MSLLTDRITAMAQRNAPLLTYYDVTTGERTELSGVTTVNWVDKTANLIVDGLDLEPGDGVRIDAKTHWSTLVWILAAWRTGLVVDSGADALAVVGPDAVSSSAETTVALSFRPLGLPFAASPASAIDFHGEVLSYPDAYIPLDEPGDDAVASRLPQAERSHADLAGADSRGRLLVTPGGLARDIDLLAGALHGGGLVIVANGTAADHDRIARDEQL